MKKIFILPMLIAPIMAHATDPVGPSAASGTPVVATASAPYATATAEDGDTTNVVSASYVKGAYNDAIAAVNNVNARITSLGDYMIDKLLPEKQDNLTVTNNNNEQAVLSGVVSSGEAVAFADFQTPIQNAETRLPTMGAVIAMAQISSAQVADSKRVSAVTTWGDDAHPTQLQLTTASN